MDDPQQPESLWSITQVSQYLGVPEATIRDWILTKRIRYHKVGRLVRFVREEVQKDFTEGRIGKRSVNETLNL